MLRNYLTVAVRNLLRHKLYTLLNLFGLSVGMACFVLIAAFVRFELNYDTYHEDSERIYRIIRRVYESDEGRLRANTGAPLLPILREELPGTDQSARLGQYGGVIKVNNLVFTEPRFFFADPDLFQVLTIPLLRGDPNSALDEPHTVLITPSIARKYFGGKDPVGETIAYSGHDFQIVGILAETPANSHFHLDFLASYSSLRTIRPASFWTHWDTRTWTYLKARSDQDPEHLQRLLTDLAKRRVDRASYDRVELVLQPIEEIHLTWANAEVEMSRRRDPSSLLTVSTLGFIILAIACINYMSLATSRSTIRSREVGIRKAVGGRRMQLVRQFLGETVILSMTAMGVAAVAAELLLPVFEELVGQRFDLQYAEDPMLVWLLVGAALLTGVGSGLYPAMFLSRFSPASVLKGGRRTEGSGVWLRMALVVSQFAVSVLLVTYAIAVYSQHRLLTGRSLGFDKERMLVVSFSYVPDRMRGFELLKRELSRDPRIVAVTTSTNRPGVTDHNSIQIRPAGSQRGAGIGIIYVDHDYVRALGLELAEGRDFSADIASDASNAVLLNETACEILGGAYSTGASVELYWRTDEREVPVYDATVVGVLRDFNHRPYLQPQPMVFAIGNSDWHHRQALVRIGAGNSLETIDFIRDTWRSLFPDAPFRHSFLDEDINGAYLAEQRWRATLTCFSGLAILIAAVGLFGLASYTAERRVKEIGIRKAMGASVLGIIVLLSKQFAKLAILANVIAWPIAYAIVQDWLQDYAYRIEPGLGVPLTAGALVLAIVLAAVSGQAVRAAMTDPVSALRYE